MDPGVADAGCPVHRHVESRTQPPPKADWQHTIFLVALLIVLSVVPFLAHTLTMGRTHGCLHLSSSKEGQVLLTKEVDTQTECVLVCRCDSLTLEVTEQSKNNNYTDRDVLSLYFISLQLLQDMTG